MYQKTFILNSEVNAIAWSPDETLLATSENSNKIIKIFDIKKGIIIKEIDKQAASTPRIAFTHDGKYLITPPLDPYDGISRTALAIIDINTWQAIQTVIGPNDPSNFPLANQPQDFQFSADRKHLYITFNGRDNSNIIYIYNSLTWEKEKIVSKQSRRFYILWWTR